MRQIAVYGKGGAGKSTIVSNLSAALAGEGRKILQVGCDPKHDSTRALIHGARPVTAVELFVKKTPETIKAGDLVMKGYRGIDCIEVGGPEPGAGCAGLGIIKTLELVTKLDLLARPYDYVFFDVLGDVVCGGFATPMRLKFAREVYIVVSGEMMSLYAANNICRGIIRYARSGAVRLGGFIANLRHANATTGILHEFAERLGSRLVHVVPWSETILDSERLKKTVIEHAPDSDAADTFRKLAGGIAGNSGFCVPTPMSDEDFEEFFTGYRDAAGD